MRVLIAGAGGLLGGEAVRAFLSRRGPRGKALHEVIATERAQLDVCSATSIRGALEALAPDWLVNCAAATDVDRCEVDRAWADALNFAAPRLLSEQCALHGVRLLHVSTDYVFDGETNGPYRETDAPQPVNYYGESKLCGEQPVLETGGTVVRTQWLYGQNKAGLIRLVLREKRVRVIDDCVGCPTWARDAADVLVKIAETGCRGLYHAANAGSATWHAYATEAARLWKRETELIPVCADTFGFIAKRPRFSALDCSKLAQEGIASPRGWKEALEAFYQTREAIV